MPTFAFRLAPLVVALSLGAAPLAEQPAPAPETLPLSAAVLARLPQDWREPVRSIKATDQEQQRFMKVTEVVLRQTLARLLVRSRAADAFLKGQLTKDPAPAVRTAIVTAIMADARWNALPETPSLIEGVIARDPEPSVSVAALETLRRWRMRQLNGLLSERLAADAGRPGNAATLAPLTEAQERWIALERGSMLPAFMRSPPPVFPVAPTDAPIRVLAFGDFGNGSPDQKRVAQTIGTYHQAQPFNLAITLGDNFYSIGMESPADPRWKTWFEDLYAPLGIPFFASLGNHDWGHPDSPASEILYTGKTPTWRMPAAYYTFTAGPVQFFALDTQSVSLAQKQREWLDRELSNSQARWKIVYGHHPIYSDGNYEDRPDLIASLLPILANRADAYICGHDHNLQALQPQRGVRFYVAGGGGAGLYDVTESPRSLFVSRSNGFAVLDADATRLVIKLVDDTGKVVYEDPIIKPLTSQ